MPSPTFTLPLAQLAIGQGPSGGAGGPDTRDDALEGFKRDVARFRPGGQTGVAPRPTTTDSFGGGTTTTDNGIGPTTPPPDPNRQNVRRTGAAISQAATVLTAIKSFNATQALVTGGQALTTMQIAGQTVRCTNVASPWLRAIPYVGAVLSFAGLAADSYECSTLEQQLKETGSPERIVDVAITSLMNGEHGLVITDEQKQQALRLAQRDLTIRDNQLALRTHLNSCGIDNGATNEIVSSATEASRTRQKIEKDLSNAQFDKTTNQICTYGGAAIGAAIGAFCGVGVLSIPGAIAGAALGAGIGGAVAGVIKLGRWLFG